MQDQVFHYLTTIPRGKVVTYSQIAKSIGHPNAARAVGNILHHNTDNIRYPCYKVVNSKGKLSCHYAFGGLSTQKRRLESDGIIVVNDRVDLTRYLWRSESLTDLPS